MSKPNFQRMPEAKTLEDFKDQNIIDVHSITIHKNNKIPTRHLILTSNSSKLPQLIKAGYLECAVRPYISNPLLCFICQPFGYFRTSCRGNLTCSYCSTVEHDCLNCNETFWCVNCKKREPFIF